MMAGALRQARGLLFEILTNSLILAVDDGSIYPPGFDKLYKHPYIHIMKGDLKPVIWMGSCRASLQAFPPKVRSDIGHALYAAQKGETDPDAKPLKGFGGASVMEILDRHDTNTYRAVYTVKFADAVYALHAFQKKSKRGIATPQGDIDLIKQRLAAAERHYKGKQN